MTLQPQEFMLQDKHQILKTKQPSDTATAGNLLQEDQMDKIKCGFTASSKCDFSNFPSEQLQIDLTVMTKKCDNITAQVAADVKLFDFYALCEREMFGPLFLFLLGYFYTMQNYEELDRYIDNECLVLRAQIAHSATTLFAW